MSTELGAGQEFAGHRIDGVAGRGGMGVVYRAVQLTLDRVVALKLIGSDLANNEGFRERFKRESQLAAAIDHDNVLTVYEAGEDEGQLYISMRWVDGTDLRALLSGTAGLNTQRAARITAQVADALDAAHASGLVHRDVKPANVLIENRNGAEHAYLSDFGLSKRAGSGESLTQTGQWVGTLDYVAPEQIEGRPVDARADVYALGCVLFQALTGDVPYPRDSELAKLWAHIQEPPPSARARRVDLPAEIDAVIARAMAKDPKERYPSAGDLGRAALAASAGQAPAQPERQVAVGPAAAGESQPTVVSQPRPHPPPAPAASVAPPSPPPPAAPTAAAPSPAPPPPAAPPPRRGIGRGVIAGIAGLAVLVAAVLAVVLLNRGDDEDGGKEPAKAAKKTGKRAPATGPLPAREAQVDKVALGPNADPGTMVADGNGVWVLDRRAGDLVRVDKVSGYVFGRVPVGKGVTDFAIHSQTEHGWIANARERTLTEITLRRGAPVGPPIKLPIGPTDITLEGSDKWIYALAAGDSESWMVRVDKKRRRVAGDPFRIDGARDLAEGSSVVAAGGDSKPLLFTLTYKLEFPKAYTLGTGKAGKVEKSPGKVWLPVQGNGGGSVLRLDEFSGKRVGRPIRVGARPNGITYSLDDGNVWVASQDGTLARIQEKSGRIVGKPISLGENEIRGDVAVAGDVVWVTANDHLIRVKP